LKESDAMTSLRTLLSPRAVAVIGASPDPHKIRGALLHLLRKNGFTGRIVPVNPSYAEIDGIPCFPSIAAAGGGVDVALIAIPADAVLAVLEDCAAAGVRHAVIISSGFAEDDAAPAELQAQIKALAQRTGMRVLGPNAEGFHNEVEHVTATFSPAVDREVDDNPTALQARIGIVAQSGGMGFALYNRGRALGLSFSSVVSTGNEADLTVADFLAHMAQDEATAGVLLFLETVRDPAGFAAAADAARAAGKFVVAIKVGRSAAGKRAAASHTASMAGWNAGYEAMFRRHGVIVAEELDEALMIAASLAGNPPARGGRVAVVTISGGAGAWSADLLTEAGLELPDLSDATQAEIRGFIPSYGSARNPIDLTAGGAQGGGMLRTVELLSRAPGIDQIAVVTTLANPARVSIDGAVLGTLLAERRKPVLFYSYTTPSPLGRQVLADAGAVICPSMAVLAKSARALMAQGRIASARTAILPPPETASPLLQGQAGPRAEHEAKALLAAAGLRVAPWRLVSDPAGLPDAAEALGFPLAVKIQSADIAHKTEAGGVRLGIVDLPALRAAFAEIVVNAARHAPTARIDGVLLEKMAAKGVEMIVGIVRDPDFGPVVMAGLGGVTTELFHDTVYRLAPIDTAEATAMLRELRGARLLDGFRGAPPSDIAALATLIARLSQLAAGCERIAELELNPVIVHPIGQGCTIADALLVLEPQG
jgi:acyl-CoA synthetase (NDP forming)